MCCSNSLILIFKIISKKEKKLLHPVGPWVSWLWWILLVSWYTFSLCNRLVLLCIIFFKNLLKKEA
jgi:hypothetical protein